MGLLTSREEYMSILEILMRPWKAQAKLKLLASAEREAEANWQELSKLRVEVASAERELESLESELAWLQDGPGVKNVGVDGVDSWIVKRYPLYVQPTFGTLREAIRYGMESE